MLRNYFKTAFRNLRRNKLYTVINILGLSAGICACLFIYLICSYEFSFDTFHPGGKRVYRIMGEVTEKSGNRLNFGRVPLAVSQHADELRGIDRLAGIIPYNASITIPSVSSPAKQFESGSGQSHFVTTAIAQPGWFTIFKYRWLQGNEAIALTTPFKVVLTEKRARQYFGNEPLQTILGRQVIYDDSLTATVSGIVEDWKRNTDLGFTDFISGATLQSSYLQSRVSTAGWGQRSMNTWTFVKLSAALTTDQLQNQLQGIVKKHADADVKLKLWLDPIQNIHFNPDVIENTIRTADKSTLYGLVAIALFILALAVINFINLSTAQSIQRAKEVGVRKVLGSSRRSLIYQFLAESLLVTAFAIVIACLMVNPLLHAFRSFIPDGVQFHFPDGRIMIFLVLAVFITSLMAGLYPARVLSAYVPVLSLKGLDARRGGEKWMVRKVLIVFQFAVSLVFIIGSIVITQQLAFTRKKNAGFNSDAIIIIPTPWNDSLSKISVLAERIKQLPSVSKVALQWLPPMTDNGRVMQLKYKSSDDKEIEVGQVAGDENFIPLYQIKLLAGRNLLHADSVRELVVNETFLHNMGFKNPADILGKQLYWNDKALPVVGVVQDFHTASFHDPISPLCVINRPDRERNLAIKFNGNQNNPSTIKTTLFKVEHLWKELYTDGTFNYQFYDESLAQLYKKDHQAATLMNTAMGITIFISCIGLFGLILFAVEKRAKEISIRKVLGAGVANILFLLSKDFVALVAIALLIATPIAWYFMNNWLNGFSYRINIDAWVFLLAGSCTILITLITIGFHATQAALSNPFKFLRSE